MGTWNENFLSLEPIEGFFEFRNKKVFPVSLNPISNEFNEKTFHAQFHGDVRFSQFRPFGVFYDLWTNSKT